VKPPKEECKERRGHMATEIIPHALRRRFCYLCEVSNWMKEYEVIQCSVRECSEIFLFPPTGSRTFSSADQFVEIWERN